MKRHTSVAFAHRIEKWEIYTDALVELGAAYGLNCAHEFYLGQLSPDRPHRCGFTFGTEARGEVFSWYGDTPPTLAEVHAVLRDANDAHKAATA